MMSPFSRLSFVITIVLMSLLLPWSIAAKEGKRFALLIGNQDYTALQPLKNPINDVRGLASSLESLGFDVTVYENLGSSANMQQRVSMFVEEARAADAETVLFHYAGHGFEIDGENYLVPAAIEPASEDAILEQVDLEMQTKPLGDDQRQDRFGEIWLDRIKTQAVNLNEVMTEIERAAPTKIVMLDACRNEPDLSRSATSLERSLQLPRSGFVITEGGAGTMVVYSTQPKATALDGDGPVSPFMGALLNHIDVLDLDINELMTKVRKDVYDYTQGKQVPWTHSALLGSFSFKPAPEGYFPKDDLIAEDQPQA